MYSESIVHATMDSTNPAYNNQQRNLNNESPSSTEAGAVTSSISSCRSTATASSSLAAVSISPLIKNSISLAKDGRLCSSDHSNYGSLATGDSDNIKESTLSSISRDSGAHSDVVVDLAAGIDQLSRYATCPNEQDHAAAPEKRQSVQWQMRSHNHNLRSHGCTKVDAIDLSSSQQPHSNTHSNVQITHHHLHSGVAASGIALDVSNSLESNNRSTDSITDGVCDFRLSDLISDVSLEAIEREQQGARNVKVEKCTSSEPKRSCSEGDTLAPLKAGDPDGSSDEKSAYQTDPSTKNSCDKSFSSVLHKTDYSKKPDESVSNSLFTTDGNSSALSLKEARKSLLKKTKPGSNNKHNKKVQFNQTVIVFCEEVEPSDELDDSKIDATDYLEAMGIFDPPQLYQEEFHHSLFENNSSLNDIVSVSNEHLLDLINGKHGSKSAKIKVSGEHSNEIASLKSLGAEAIIPKGVEKGITPAHALSSEPILDGLTNTVQSRRKESPETQKMIPAQVKVSQVDSIRAKRQASKPHNNTVNSLNVCQNNPAFKSASLGTRKIQPTFAPTRNVNHPNTTQTVNSNKCSYNQEALPKQKTTNSVNHNFDQVNIQSQLVRRIIDPDKKVPLHNEMDRSTPANQSSNIIQKQDTHKQQKNCYICSALENVNYRNASNLNMPEINESRPSAQIPDLVPAVVRPSVVSCKTCQESVSRLQNQSITPKPAQLRPVSCEVVNIIDQLGNKIKALSVIYPSQPGVINPLAGRRVLIVNENLVQTNPHLFRQVNVASHNADDIKVQQSSGLIDQSINFVNTGICNTNNHHFTSRPNASKIQDAVAQARPIHTFYYVHQPLANSNRPLTESGSNRAFPDPHEVRRLDGIKNIPNMGSALKKNSELDGLRAGGIEDEIDDPTFGFSVRPSVKGLAASHTNSRSSQQVPGLQADHSKTNAHFSQGGLISNDHKPMSFPGIQTIERNIISQRDSQRKNVAGTSLSMSNIQAILMPKPINAISNDSHAFTKQPKTTSVTGESKDWCQIDAYMKNLNYNNNNLIASMPTPRQVIPITAYGRHSSTIGMQSNAAFKQPELACDQDVKSQLFYPMDI